MPFVGNTTAFVTGAVPEDDLKRLNGNREEYSRRVTAVITVAPFVLVAAVALFNVLGVFSDTVTVLALIGVMVVGIIFRPAWELCNPREKNRRTWDRYSFAQQLHESGYLGYDLVMSPQVIAHIDACDDEAAKFLRWYSAQGFGMSGPITEDEASALAELRHRLVSGVGAVLEKLGANDVPGHIDAVLDVVRWNCHERLKSDVAEAEERLKELQAEVEATTKELADAIAERAYLREQMNLAQK